MSIRWQKHFDFVLGRPFAVDQPKGRDLQSVWAIRSCSHCGEHRKQTGTGHSSGTPREVALRPGRRCSAAARRPGISPLVLVRSDASSPSLTTAGTASSPTTPRGVSRSRPYLVICLPPLSLWGRRPVDLLAPADAACPIDGSI